jgi:inner membrane protein
VNIDANSLTFRGIALGGLVLVMLLPVGMVGNLVDERHDRYQAVVQEVGAEWGGQQTITGPAILVPFTERWTDESVIGENGSVRQITREQTRDDVLVVLPEHLDVQATMDVERRLRGIYEATVYTTNATLRGAFAMGGQPTPSGRTVEYHWDDATLALGVSSPVGVQHVESGAMQPLQRAEPDTSSVLLPHGMHWRARDARELANGGAFDISIVLRGSESIAITPVGATTRLTVTSRWPHPGFIGVLPSTRDVGADGFRAQWSVSSLARGYPQQFVQSQASSALDETSAGIRLVQPVHLYSLTERAVKYAVLFIALTITTFLVFELITGAQVHFVQYGLIGAAVAIFYLLLLALSEHIGFGGAYAIAAIAVTAMITSYAAAVLLQWRRAALIGTLQSATYAILYVVLRLEDYALLTGTVALFVALAALMFFTRSLPRAIPNGPALVQASR